MLTRSERIKYSGLFTQAFEKGKRVNGKNISVVYTATRRDLRHQLPLTGFVVGKSYSKKAVARNKIKRQVREIYRLYRMKEENQARLNKVGLLVIRVKAKESLKDFQALEKEVLDLLDRISPPEPY